MKQTPEIIIPAKQINSCDKCPYYEETERGIYGYGTPNEAYCNHPSFKFGQRMNYGKFLTLLDTNIWVYCPLPDVQDKEN